MKTLIAFLFRTLLKSRYKVKIKSDIELHKFRSTLILPNHPAETDPVIISSFLWDYFEPQPVTLETIFEMPGINSILRHVKAIPMPDMERGSGFYKRKRIQQALTNIVESLNSGSNILIYPSGRLSLDGREIIGGASGIHSILSALKDNKDLKVILVRTTGLWGSRFSKAQTDGKRPDIVKGVLSSIKTILKNLIFFVPKREIEIEMQGIPSSELLRLDINELNNYLQSWYNLNGTEPLKLVKDCFWHKAPAPIQKSQTSTAYQNLSVDAEVESKVIAHLAKISSKQPSQIKRESSFSEDLGLDSLIVAELILWLDEEFEITDIELAELKTVNDLLSAIVSQSGKSDIPKLTAAPDSWNKNISTSPAKIPANSKNLGIAIIHSCKENPSLPALSDPLLGIKSYSELLAAALLFKKHFQQFKEDKVAILLPASATVSIVSLAIWMAGKTPVYLNWTAGIKSLKHCVSSLNIRQIITAGSVLDKISADLSELGDLFVLLEEIKKQFKLTDKLTALLESRLPARKLISRLQLEKISEDETAAILFTSGSETKPKTVPLSHKNILTNISDIFSCFEISKADVLFGFLPPFHSFGLTVTTILPLVGGIRVAFYPDPNESRKIASSCYTWGITIMAGTPSFLRGVLSAAGPEAFGSLRVMMSGAEKLPDDLRNLARTKVPQAQLLEGYGITECSPVVSAQRLHRVQAGVGESLPNVKIRIVDQNSFTEKAAGETGLILISGDSIFKGYLESDKNPFIQLDGVNWYNSGDLGYLKNDCLVLEGRLRRFVKIGGEMISLPALEETLQKTLNGKDVSQFAVIDVQEADANRVSLLLFTNYPDLDHERVNKMLRDQGFTSLTKIRKVLYLKELPVLGSGKIDYVSLRKQAEAESL